MLLVPEVVVALLKAELFVAAVVVAEDDEEDEERREDAAENWLNEELGLVSGELSDDWRKELDELDRVRLTPEPMIRLDEPPDDDDVPTTFGVLYENKSFLSNRFNRSAYFLSSLSLF